MIIKWLTLFTLCSWLASIAYADTDWRRVIDDQESDVQVWLRPVEGSALQAFRGETRVKSRLTAAVALLEDNAVAPRWMHNCGGIEVIEQVSPTQAVSYMISEAPWPVSDRDVIVETQIRQSDLGVVTLTVNSRDDVLPVHDEFVRIPKMQGFWRFTPQADGYLKVEYQAHADPGGSLPSWLANSVVEETPYYTLKAFRQWVQTPKYQEAERSFIREVTVSKTTAPH
ncbi:hypothetical protein GCM10011297_03990 [Bacterioplanes sanyensis]|uniref:START domain-containing protein n=1 Tax=Bacterioplanes sanyensis TaxID=1249553 RepID=UPI0016729004|nr:START domain-containing protein [Bacterioplanes sanyensis]GGY34173.1 hypothetical protein GCM10011297_03990 [Bacterioplanes sanyensis]